MGGAFCPFPFSPGLSAQGARRWELTLALEVAGEGAAPLGARGPPADPPGEAGFVPHVAALRGSVTQAPRGCSICPAPLRCL